MDGGSSASVAGDHLVVVVVVVMCVCGRACVYLSVCVWGGGGGGGACEACDYVRVFVCVSVYVKTVSILMFNILMEKKVIKINKNKYK